MSKKFTKGFTLIELLVVIAIIGILSSVVLASLNSARAKGSDAAVKANLANIRAQAEIVYDNSSNSYDTVCTDSTVAQAVTAANSAGSGDSGCFDDGDSWVAYANLKSAPATFWCVDSTGKSNGTTTEPTTANTGC
jgi:prepilin-type N-terminal cleavage/methylation domain-containing protein